MDMRNIENLLGALSLHLVDGVSQATDNSSPEPGSATAALSLVHHEPGIGIERLRKALGLSHPGTVRLVDRLEGADLLVRKPNGTDRRAVSLHLTDNGSAHVDNILSARQASIQSALGSLTPKEKAQLGKLAFKMLKGLVVDLDTAYRVCRLCDGNSCLQCPAEDALTPPPQP